MIHSASSTDKSPSAIRVAYISWAPHCSRSDHTARELGGTSHMVYWGWLGSHPTTIWLKYFGQAFSTWKVLIGERPDAVFVMTPPPVAVMAVYLYCSFTGARFVIDAHTGAFEKRWRLFQHAQFWLCQRAAATIVSNDHLGERVRANGGRVVVVPDVPIRFDLEQFSSATASDFEVVCVTSFDRDEPIHAMVEAARRVQDTQFLMTGDASKARRIVQTALPPNLRLTGFVDTQTYGRLLRNAGVVVALTTNDHTMQRGAYEAIYQGTPVIVSDNPLLKREFDEGAIHVDNSPEAIATAVQRIRDAHAEYKDAAMRLRTRKTHRWEQTKDALLDALREQRREA